MRKIETTQSSFLLRYGASLVVATELFMIITIMILYATNGMVIPTCIMLFLAPLFGGMIAGKLSKKMKKILFKEHFNRYFFITTIIVYILVYLFNFRFNVMLAIIYAIGAIIGGVSAKKSIQKLKEIIETSKGEEETFIEGEKISIKDFKLEKFTGEHIRDFLKMNHLDDDNYLLAEVVPTAKEYIIYGYFSLSGYIQYIIHFDNQKIYFFELSKLTSKSIKNGFLVNFEEIQVKKVKKGIISYKIKLEFKDGSKINMRILKRVARLYSQKQYAEKLYNKFLELKNKDK